MSDSSTGASSRGSEPGTKSEQFYYGPQDSVLNLIGAIYTEPRADGGVRPHRLPEKLLGELPSVFMRAVVDTAAGVRLRFETEATRMKLEVKIHPIEFVGIPPYGAAIDLVVNGETVASQAVEGGLALVDSTRDSLEEGATERQCIIFDGLDPQMKTVELWLPHSAIVDVYGLTANRPVRPALGSFRQWIHHGSSISHCLEATHPTGTWPALAARLLQYDLLDLGFAGSAMLDPFVARTIRDQRADLITLKLGINLVNVDLMKMRAFIPALNGFLDTIRDGHPTTPIVLISPISCPVAERTPGPMGTDPATGMAVSLSTDPSALDALTLERIRDAMKILVERRGETDAFLSYLDGRELFGTADAAQGRLPDGLHPDQAGYTLMGERFAQLIPPILSR